MDKGQIIEGKWLILLFLKGRGFKEGAGWYSSRGFN